LEIVKKYIKIRGKLIFSTVFLSLFVILPILALVFSVVKIDTSGIIQEFHEKVQNPPSTTANGAVYIIEASVISYMERLKKVKVDFSVDVLPNYMGRIFTYYNGLYHRDIGNIRSYELAQIETDSLYRETS